MIIVDSKISVFAHFILFHQVECDSLDPRAMFLTNGNSFEGLSFLSLFYVDWLTQSNNLWHKTFHHDDHHYS